MSWRIHLKNGESSSDCNDENKHESILEGEMKFLGFLSLCILAIAFVSPMAGQAQESFPQFEPSKCPINVPDSPPIDCGYLVVPEDYDNPEKATIRLPIIIIHSLNKNAAPDPVLFTEGGPGMSTLSYVWAFSKSAYINNRDIVLFEQRGNRYAQPSLECDASIWTEERPGYTPCLDSLRDRNIDLTQYTTQRIAKDVNALINILDYERWNLYGTSYSTRVMQIVMRDYPERIRSVILQSVSRLDETRYEHDPEHAVRALSVLFRDCAADPACVGAYPDLENRFYKLFSRLNANPVSFEMTLPSPGGEPFIEHVDGYRFLGWMILDAFYGPAFPPSETAYFPLLIDQVEKGNTDLLYPWLEAEVNAQSSDWTDFNWGLFFAINCQDDSASVTPEDQQRQIDSYPELEGYARQTRELEICEAWGLPAAPGLADEPITSDIPTLVLSGAYDPITPPEWSKAVADQLSNSYYYEFPASGHSVDSYNPCAESIKAAFVNDPFVSPDTSCMEQAPQPQFVLPGDVLVMDGLYRSLYEVSLGSPDGDPILEGIFIACTLIFVAEILFLVMSGVIRLVRGRKGEPQDRIARIAHPLTGMVVLLNIGFFMSWSAFIYPEVFSTTPLILRFGVPSEYTPPFALPIMAFILTLVLVGITFLAWKRQFWSRFGRIFFSLVTLAAVGFAGFLIRWGVLTALF
jgi:pimeloyl-ACP methyl ester carboxylesterase